MLNFSSLSPTFPHNCIKAEASTDLSFLKWSSYCNSANSDLIITATQVFNFVDLYGFKKDGFNDKNGSPVKSLHRFKASAGISCLSDAKQGVLSYGCNNGNYGFLEVKSRLNDGILVPFGKIQSMGDYVTAMDLNNDSLFIGTQNGKLAVENIKQIESRNILSEKESSIKAIHAYSSNLCLVGHDCGGVGLWDLRDREENVINFDIKKNYRGSYKMFDKVNSCHLRDEYLAIVGTGYGHVKFIDMRFPTQKYPCALKVSAKSITSVRFSDISSNIVLITCYEGYLEIRNDALTSLWFHDNELDVPPWLKGNHYDKLQTSWTSELKDLIGMDVRGNEKVIGSNDGNLCFIIP